ncbi:MAG: exodeoxyribonuclease VII large subunit [Candidatus Pacebacteria bacterium]|nr:exodeoxyribonuclease VII large subunit [Candidatus Paceibacterota bacterium]
MKLSPKIYSVSDYLDLLNEQLNSFEMAVQGEITSLSMRNHAYFSLSDGNKTSEKSVMTCALWQFRLKSLPFVLEEGMEVQVIGKANIYKPTGRLTFVVEHIVPVGEGALQKAFEALKKKLTAKGYFALERKQPLPVYPVNIGLLTSETGDAIRDFQTHLGKFGFKIFHYDIKVEGIYAIDSIVEGFRYFNEHPRINGQKLDVIVLTRGGGSLESLQAFNSEEVAQAIFASKIPVLSAVGHERDVTIADLVADVRASTPTDAGRVLSENWRSLASKVDYFSKFFLQITEQIINRYNQQLEHHWDKINQIFFSKLAYFFEKNDYYFHLVNNNFLKFLNNFKQNLVSLDKQIKSNHPQLKLKQGYSLVKDKTGKLVKSVNQIEVKQTLKVSVSDGEFGIIVEKK